MDESRKRRNRSGAQEEESIPELIQNIQSRLPVKAAARTSILSKSWLHAWSTIPSLRFHHIPTKIFKYHKGDEEYEINSLKLDDVDRTLMRYIADNIPIETFELIIEIENKKSACLAKKWLLHLATKTRVKELSLRIRLSGRHVRYFNLPHEILSSENLTKLRVITRDYYHVTMESSNDPVMIIKCVSLRELHLDGLGISQKILDGLLSSSCTSLEKVQLLRCSGYVKTNVENLPCLYELKIELDHRDVFSTDFVISHLPNLGFFSCRVNNGCLNVRPFNALSISLGSSVTQLKLEGLAIDNTSLDMIKSGSPYLESVTLDMTFWMLESFHFTSTSIKSFFLHSCPSRLMDVQIHAPKLSHLEYGGKASLPSILLPVSTTLEKLHLLLQIDMMNVDASFFLNLRETLTLSHKCYLNIQTYNYNKLPLDIDMKDLRRRLLLPPARNVADLWFETDNDRCQWEGSSFFDALFEICHPEQVSAMFDKSFKYNNHFCRLMLKEVLQNNNKTGRTVCWPHYLENVQIKRDCPHENWQTVYWPHCLENVQIKHHENWETLTNSRRSLIEGKTPYVFMLFKLKWRE